MLKNKKSTIFKDREISVENYTLNASNLGIDSILNLKGLGNLKKLRILDLSHNQIKEINGLENLINLKILKLNNNKIRKIKGLDSLQELEVLMLNDNLIENISGLYNCLNLNVLTLHNNIIQRIENLHHLPNLENLTLKGNPLSPKVKSQSPEDIIWLSKKNETADKERKILEKFLKILTEINPKEQIVGQTKLKNLEEKLLKTGIEFLTEDKDEILKQIKTQKRLLKEDYQAIKRLDREKLEEERKRKIQTIRNTVLDLGMKFTRIQINEVAEKCDMRDESQIIDVVGDMIAKKEIHAEYFKSSRSIAFNQLANIEEMKKLDEEFKSWGENEDVKFGKKD